MHLLTFKRVSSSCNTSLRGLLLLLCCAVGLGSSLRVSVAGLDANMKTAWSVERQPAEESPAEQSPGEPSPAEEVEPEQVASSVSAMQRQGRQSLVRLSWTYAGCGDALRSSRTTRPLGALGMRNGCGALLRC